MIISAFPWHNVAWLYDTVSSDRIEDKDDLWVKTWGTQLHENHHGGMDKKALLRKEEKEWINAHKHSFPTGPTRALEHVSNIFSGIVVITVYLMSTGLTGKALMESNYSSNCAMFFMFTVNMFIVTLFYLFVSLYATCGK